jgi:hypothetical protein
MNRLWQYNENHSLEILVKETIETSYKPMLNLDLPQKMDSVVKLYRIKSVEEVECVVLGQWILSVTIFLFCVMSLCSHENGLGDY